MEIENTSLTDDTKKIPQLATSGLSREQALSNIAFFFGDPASPEKLRDYSEHHAMTYAYYGQSTKIRDTLNNLILRSPQEWQTTTALPFVHIEGTTVDWDEMRFDVRLLQRVPYEGISRMQTSLRRRHRDRVVRRGIGMTIEHDFYATEKGREHFRDQLTSIRYCVQETCNFDVLHAYLSASNYDFRYDLSKGLRSKRSVRQAMFHEIMMYATVQKDGLGFDRAVEEVKNRMGRYQVTPDMIILPPQLLLYMATAPDEKIKFYEGGERAVSRFEEGVRAYENTFRGLRVFTSMPFEVSEEAEAVQMLQRQTQVGEFYRMCPPHAWDPKKLLPVGGNYMDILIYDEEADQHKRITFKEALYAALPADGDKDTNTLLKELLNEDKGEFLAELKRLFGIADASRDGSTSEALPALSSSEEPTGMRLSGESTFIDDKFFGQGQLEVKAAQALEQLMRGVTVDNVLKCVECGIWLPLCITIARPFIEHITSSAVVTVAGRATGATLFGPADMQISANTSVKTIEGCHTKAVITRPENVYVMRDIMCNSYVAGGNTMFFGCTRNANGDYDVTPHSIQADLEARLNLDDQAAGEYKSMFAFLTSYKEVEVSRRDQVISVSSRVLPWEVQPSHMDKKDYFPGGQSTFDKYKSICGLDTIHFGEDVRASENAAFISQGSTNNSLCFIGPHRKYNPFSQNFYELVPGQGHFGPDAIPGDARWRRGESVNLKEARDSMTSIEVAAHSQLALRPANLHGHF